MKVNKNLDLNQLKKLPISDVAKKLGLQLHANKCLCFLHEENTPSFSINTRCNTWRCFGCENKGDVIELVKRYNGYNFIEACKWLSNEFGIGIYNIKHVNQQKEIVRTCLKNKNAPNPEIYKWFFDNISVTENVKKFIRSRKYPERIIEKYNLKGTDDCYSCFEKCQAKWGNEQLLKCGLAKETIDTETGEIKYKFTWWTSTLFFPFYNNKGEIIYIQGRTLNSEQEKKFKYVNLCGVETPLFNLPILGTLKKNDALLVTEGITDCISSCLMGKNAVGVIGAQGFKRSYAQILRDFNINVVPDNDKNRTGEKFANKIKTEFLSIGKTIEIHFLSRAYKDISEYYYSTAESWEK